MLHDAGVYLPLSRRTRDNRAPVTVGAPMSSRKALGGGVGQHHLLSATIASAPARCCVRGRNITGGAPARATAARVKKAASAAACAAVRIVPIRSGPT